MVLGIKAYCSVLFNTINKPNLESQGDSGLGPAGNLVKIGQFCIGRQLTCGFLQIQSPNKKHNQLFTGYRAVG
ncbi:hypothetical protein D3C75_1103800 [compost metagenome]